MLELVRAASARPARDLFRLALRLPHLQRAPPRAARGCPVSKATQVLELEREIAELKAALVAYDMLQQRGAVSLVSAPLFLPFQFDSSPPVDGLLEHVDLYFEWEANTGARHQTRERLRVPRFARVRFSDLTMMRLTLLALPIGPWSLPDGVR